MSRKNDVVVTIAGEEDTLESSLISGGGEELEEKEAGEGGGLELTQLGAGSSKKPIYGTEQGMYERTLKISSLPVFNTMQLSKLMRVIRDTDASLWHFLHALSESALWCVPGREIDLSKREEECQTSGCEQENWEKLLAIFGFDQFAWDPGEGVSRSKENWPVMALSKEFSVARIAYRKMNTADKPWSLDAFRELQQRVDIAMPFFQRMLLVGFQEAEIRREKGGIPKRRLLCVGDMFCGDSPIAGDQAVAAVFHVASQYKIPLTVMASNHGFFFLKLDYFLKSRFGGESFSKYLRQKQSDKAAALDLDEVTGNILKNVVEGSIRENKPVQRDLLIDSIKKIKASGRLSNETLLDIFQFIRSIPVDFLQPYEGKRLLHRLSQLLPFSPIKKAVLFRVAVKKVRMLTDNTPISKALWELIEASSEVTESKKKLLRTPMQVISRDQLAPLKEILSDIDSQACFSSSDKHQMGLIRGSIEEKIASNDGKEETYTALLNLLELISTLEELRGKKLAVLKDILAKVDKNDYFDFNRKELIEQLLSLRGREEIFTDLRQFIDDVLMAFESVLRQTTTLPEDSDVFRASATPLWAFLLPRGEGVEVERGVGKGYDDNEPDIDMLDSSGRPTPPVKKRVEIIERDIFAWSEAMRLITRSGLKGPYIRHAPAVGLKDEGSDESVVKHSFIPLAGIMLKALAANKKRGDDQLNGEKMAEIVSQLEAALTEINRFEITDNPVIHINILRLMQALNEAFDFFKNNKLLVLNFTTQIPETHIGFLSCIVDEDVRNHYIDVLQRSGNLPEGYQPGGMPYDHIMSDFGVTTMLNPILTLLFPFAAWVWNRSYDSVSYYDKSTGKLLLETQSVLNVSHSHTSEPGPHGMGLDRKFKAGKLDIDDCYALFEAPYDPEEIPRLKAALGSASNNPDSFWPSLFKDLIQRDLGQREERASSLSRSGSLGEERGGVAQTKSVCDIILDASIQIRNLFLSELRNADGIYLPLEQLLSDLKRHLRHDKSDEAVNLRSRLELASQYRPDGEDVKSRVDCVIGAIKELERNHDIDISNRLSFWLSLYALNEKTIALMPEEVVGYFLGSSSQDQLSGAQQMRAFLDMRNFSQSLNEEVQVVIASSAQVLRLGFEDLVKHEKIKGRSSLDKARLVSKALAMPAATASGIASMSVIGYFQPYDTFLGELKEMAGWKMWLGLTLLFEALFVLSELDRSKRPKGARFFLAAVERFVPQDTSAAQLPIFGLPIRVILWQEVGTIFYRILTWLSGAASYCAEEDSLQDTGNQTTQGRFPTASPKSTLAGGTTVSPTFADVNPWVTPSVAVGGTIGFIFLVLSMVSRSNMFPGHKPPEDKLHDGKERSPAQKKIYRFGRDYNNWVSGNIVILVGSYFIQVLSGVTCGNPQSAVSSSSIALTFLVIRTVIYPPKRVTSGCIKLQQKTCPKSLPKENCLALSAKRKRGVEITYYAVASLLELSFRFFIVTYFGGAFLIGNAIDPEYEMETLLQSFLDTPANEGMLGVSVLLCTLTFVDDTLAFLSQVNKTDHAKKAATIRDSLKRVTPRARRNSHYLSHKRKAKKSGPDIYLGPPPMYLEV